VVVDRNDETRLHGCSPDRRPRARRTRPLA
jgi:hypothetical protein